MHRQVMAMAALAALLAAGVARAEPGAQKPTLAVLYLNYDGDDKELIALRKGLAQMLTTDLAANLFDHVDLVERAELEAVLAEQKLQQTSNFDRATAVRVGKLLGARMLLLGSYFGLRTALRADVRIVDVETGKLLAAAGSAGKPDDFMPLEQQLAQKISDQLPRRLPQLPPLPAEAVRPRRATTPAADPPTGADPEKPVDPPPPPVRPKKLAPPKKLKPQLALRYSKALDAMDRKDTEVARKELAAVVAEQPDFTYASADLDRMLK